MGSVTGSASYHYRLLSSAEVRLTKQTIANYIQDISAYAREIRIAWESAEGCEDEEMRATYLERVRSLTSEMERIKTLFYEKRSLIAPIRNLPAELLAFIFEIHVGEHDHNPLVILAVCRSWRYIARGVPSLWTRIHVKIRPLGLQNDRALQWYGPNAHLGIVVRHTEEIKQVIQLAGNRPLDITLDATIISTNIAAFDLVCSSSHRWRSLRWRLESSKQGWTLAEHWAGKDIAFPLLKKLAIDQACPQTDLDILLQTIENTATKLDMVVAHSTVSEPLYRRKKMLKGVKHLRWSGSFHPPAYLLLGPQPTTVPLWEEFRALETLYLFRNLPQYSAVDELQEPSPLRALAFEGSPFTNLTGWGPNLLLLRYMHIESVPHSMYANPPGPQSIQLPTTTHFTLTNETYLPLSWFSLPSLACLELYGGVSAGKAARESIDSIWNDELIGTAPVPSETLHIQPVGSQHIIINILKYLSNIKCLHLYHRSPSEISKRLLELLAQGPKNQKDTPKSPRKASRSSVDKRAEWTAKTCPNLRSMTIVCKRVREQEREECLQAFRSIRRARLGTKSEIQSLVLTLYSKWGRGSENEASKMCMNF